MQLTRPPGDPTSAEGGDRGPHVHLHRAPPVHRGGRGRDPRAGARRRLAARRAPRVARRPRLALRAPVGAPERRRAQVNRPAPD